MMSKDASLPPTLTRRGFVTSMIGAGIALQLTWTPGSRASVARSTPLNPWITVQPDGTAVIAIVRSEMGQGIETGIAMLVAEELEADWSRIATRWVPWDPVYGVQRTAASESMRSLWLPMREVAATAREMLRTAAASDWGVDPASCRVENSQVVHSDGRRLDYGQIAQSAARLPVPATPTLKPVSEFRIIGKRKPRLDARGAVTGRLEYGQDVEVPGMLHASIERCPYVGGRLLEFDGASALTGFSRNSKARRRLPTPGAWSTAAI